MVSTTKRFCWLCICWVVALLTMGCEKYPEGSIEMIVASEQSYILGENRLPQARHIVRTNSEGSEWEVVDLRNTIFMEYERGYEYIIMAHKESFEPNVFPQFPKKFWWQVDALVEKIQKESNLPENIYIYTPDSPWGFDPRDPMLEYLLNHPEELP